MVELSKNDEKIIKLIKDYKNILKEYKQLEREKYDLRFDINTMTIRLLDKYSIRLDDKYEDTFVVTYVGNNGLLKLIDLDDVKFIEELFNARFSELKSGTYYFRMKF